MPSGALADHELEAARRRGFDVAYRMLGSVAEAEDVAQEATLRLARSPGAVEEPTAWITTVATRLAIDHLRLARVRRESYVGPWLPEPLVDAGAPDPAARAQLAESLSLAFLVVLERLTPLERAAFLLRDVFDYDYAEIAAILDRSEASCRQLVTRARWHVAAERPRFDPDPALRDELLARFLTAADEGDLAGLEALLADDAMFYADGGGKKAAARRPVGGAARIARVMAGIARLRHRRAPDLELQLVTIGGQPGLLARGPDGRVTDVLSVDVAGGRIQAVRIVRNPDKLAHL
jgi:RNA polymerase sigma-70 factor, ECF subfamily